MKTETELFETKVRSAIADGKIVGDGHTLFSAEFYAPHFTETELTEAGLLRDHNSDHASWKSTIYGSNGEVIEELFAVYNLDFLYWVALKIGVTESVRAIGRGSQAQELVGYISQKLA